jgi:hypothetical protein
MNRFKLELTGDQISWLQYLMEDLCDERGGYSKLEPVMQDLIDKVYNAKPVTQTQYDKSEII